MNYNKIKKELRKIINKDTVFVCIGTHKVNFDKFGPICGDYLKSKNIPHFGDSDNNVNGVNMHSRLNEIYKKHKIDNCNIVAIDASVTYREGHVNKVTVNKNRGVKPGAGVGKLFPEVGVNSILMYTLNKEDLKTTMDGYRKGNGNKYDKSDLELIKENAKIITDLIEEVYNEVRNVNLI